MPRRLGQHFLHNQGVLRRIAEAVAPEPVDTVVEIGPGKGALTARLLERARRVVAVELDRELAESLRRRFSGAANLEILQADVLKTDLARYMPAVIAGNLPYYITSPILERVLQLAPRFPRAVFLVQREVAERLTAEPGRRAYSYLTVATAVFAGVRILCRVSPGSFSPPPKVESAVVILEPRPAPLVADPPRFLEFVSACFREKRKTLKNNLQALYPQIRELPEASLRAEQLSLEQFRKLYGVLTRPA